MAYKNHHYSVDLDLSGVELIERRTIGIGPGNGNKRKNNKVIETAYMEYWRARRRVSDQGIYFGSSISEEVVLC